MRLLVGFLLCAAIGAAQTDVRELLEKKALDRIAQLDRSLDGTLGVAAIDLTTGRTLTYNANAVFPTASTIKVAVMVELFRRTHNGNLRLDQEMPLAPADLVDGSLRVAVMLRKGATTATLRELIEAMIEVSDNTAANKLIDLAGMDRVNAMLDGFGMPATRVRRKMMDWVDTEHRENIGTPMELARLMEMIYRGKASNADDCAAMLKIMKRVEGDVRKAVPSKIEVAAKPGDIPGARGEMGIVFVPNRPFALCVMSTFVADDRNPTPEVTAILYDLFAKLGGANRYGHVNP